MEYSDLTVEIFSCPLQKNHSSLAGLDGRSGKGVIVVLDRGLWYNEMDFQFSVERKGVRGVRKKISPSFVILSAVVYAFALYYILFRLVGREMVIMSEHMLDNYNYWNSVNLMPFKTITQYVAAIGEGSIRGHAIRNLGGNLFLLFPLGFYLPFFSRRLTGIKVYSIIAAAFIIAIETTQLITMSGSLDIDDFILNFIGAVIGFSIFKYTPARSLFKLRAKDAT